LPSQFARDIVFQKDQQSGSRFSRLTRDWGRAVKGREGGRKWRRKPLKSLKTDAEIAVRPLAGPWERAPTRRLP
jgi:hypothetical protein